MVFKRLTGSSKNKSQRSMQARELQLELLEARQLLAADFGVDLVSADETLIEIADPFARDAVSFGQIAERTLEHTHVPNELLVAIEGPLGIQSRNASDLVDWSTSLPEFRVEPINTIMSFDNSETSSFSLVHIDLGEDADLIQAMRELDSHHNVLWSTPNFVYEGDDPRDLIPNDPQFGSQYHHTLIGNVDAWDISVGDSNIVIGVTDDGVDIQHEDLQQAIWVNAGETPGDGIDNDGNGYIDDVNGYNFLDGNNNPDSLSGDDHGTHVAGIAAAGLDNGIGVSGTAGGATILPLKWYDGGTWTAAIISETFTYAADNGANIVNTSYNMDGWASDPVVHAAFDYMYDAGVLHFNSAGNGSSANPARQVFEQTLLVASTTSSDAKSGFSNWGTGVDISAPGSDILSSTPNNTYSVFSGTSMAAPNAAGVAALIWSANPTWTREQVVAQLQGTADDIDSLNPAFAGLLGSGRVNTFNALTGTVSAPTVQLVDGVPPGGSTSAANPISGFGIKFNQLMDAASVLDASNYELRGAGADGAFDTADDEILSMTMATTEYLVGSGNVNLDVDLGALGIGSYRLSVLSGGTMNPFGTALDGNADGIAGDDYQAFFSVGIEPFVYDGIAAGIGSSSTGNPGTLGGATDTDSYPFFVEAGESVTAVIRPSDPSVTVSAEFTSLGASVTAANPGETLIVPLTSVPTTGNVMLSVSGDTASAYQFDIYRNINVEGIAGGVTDFSDSFFDLGSGTGRYQAIGRSAGSDGGVQFQQSSNAAAFVDISSTGTSLGLDDDGEATITTTVGNAIFPAGSVTVGNNGAVVAGAGVAIDYVNENLPTADYAAQALLPFWDDIDDNTGDVYWQETTIGGINSLIIQWNARPHFNNVGEGTFQVQLFDSGPVLARYAYQDVEFGDVAFDGGASATIGYQASSTSGMEFSFNTASVSNGDVIDILDLPPTTDVDDYQVNLTAGDQIDIVAVGLNGRSLTNETIELYDSSSVLLATASNSSAGNTIQNFDQGILGYTVPATGTYTVRVSSDQFVDYSILVTEDIVFDTEANGDPTLATRPLDPVSGALGSIQGGTLSFNQFNDAGGFIDITATGTALGLDDDGEATIVTTVGNDVFPAGSVTVGNNGGIIAGGGASLGTGNSALPSASWATALMPFWDDIDADTGDVYWEERMVGGVNTLIVQWTDRPRFSFIGDATFQVQVAESGTPVRFAYRDVDFGDPQYNGGASATIGIQVSGTSFVNVSVDTAAVADNDVIDFAATEYDMYPLTLAAAETVTLMTSTPLDDVNNVPRNTLDPALIIFDAAGNPLAMDSNSAADGKNASLTFTAASAATYYVAVEGEGGAGDYVLSLGGSVIDGDFDDDGDYDCHDIDALTTAIAAGSTDLSFDLTGDGDLNLADRDAWLAEGALANGFASPYLLGDANLDGTVNGMDFLIWNANKFTATAGWCNGDFNADGSVNGGDFLNWNAFKFQSSDALVAETDEQLTMAASDQDLVTTAETTAWLAPQVSRRDSLVDSTFARYAEQHDDEEEPNALASLFGLN